MKIKFLVTVLMLLIFSTLTFAGEVDDRFKTAQKYLRDNNEEVSTSVEEVFTKDYIIVVGEGSPKKGSVKGQKRLTALTAAKVVAQRHLAEMISGVAIVSETTVQDSELVSDTIKSAVTGLVKGAHIVVQEWNEAEETALVVMKIGTKGPRSISATMYEKILDEPTIKKELNQPVYVPPPVEPTPTKPAPVATAETPKADPTTKQKEVVNAAPYDGLIVDATEENFQPALINRIFSMAGEVLYDPAKISQKVLIEQGCGEYTNNIDKAKAALGTRGVSNPLVLKASGIQSKSDLKVSDADAAKIYAANQSTGFIAKAQVAFVLK
ncbi:MAG: hypothetical protein PHN84_08255 [Desulfuromonadaceae bacterium]|nr:hypothetical protein [Desulfuromonadaceae bacterium]